jgi:hypothetical protein
MDRFVYTVPGTTKTVSLTPFDRLPAGVFRKARKMGEMDMTFSLIEAATDEAGLEVVDAMPLPDLNDLFLAWSEASGADLPSS